MDLHLRRSWPAPPQSTTPSSTWPQSSQNAHLFGHPSPLHPTWSSSASLVPSASAPTSRPFTSLTSTPHAVPGPQIVPTMPTPMAPENRSGAHRSTDFFHSYGTHRSTHMAFSPGSITYIDYTTYIRLHHPTTFAELSIPTSPHSTLHYRLTHRWPLQMNLHLQQLRLPPGFALTSKRTNHVGQLRKPLLLLHHRHLLQHRLHPFHLNLQRWAPPHSNLRNRFDLFKLNNN